MSNRTPILYFGLFLCLALAACSGRGRVGSLSDEAKGISESLDLLNDYRGDPKKCEQLFVAGTTLPDARVLSKYTFSLRGSQSASGTTVTLPVMVYDETAGQEVGVFDWTFEKDGGRWKIKSLQLP
jgi:hypothetical protein